MKRIVCLLLVLVLCLPLVLASCARDRDLDDEIEESERDTEADASSNDDKDDKGNKNDKTDKDDKDDKNDQSADKDDAKDDADKSPANKPGNDDNENQDDGGDDDGNDGGEQVVEPDVDNPAGAQIKKVYTYFSDGGTGTSVNTLLDKSVSDYMKTYIEANTGTGNPYAEGVAPFVLRNDLGMGNAKLTSITIPVKETRTVDNDGNFVFTLAVYPKLADADAAKTASPNHTYYIKISASQYGLSENNTDVRKVINVDLSSYNIYIEANETLGFSRQEGDTLLPLFFFVNNSADNTIRTYFEGKCPALKSFFTSVGRSDAGTDYSNVLCFDFTYETTAAPLSQTKYDNKSEFESVVTTAFNQNGGKLISSYMPANLIEMIKNRVAQKELKAESFHMPAAPFAPNKDIGLSGTRLTSITIPVMGTGSAVNGNYTFTLSVINKDADRKTANAIAYQKTILISQSAYGLTNGNSAVYKLITVDLTSYNIVIGENQTIGFGKDGDTLLPIYIASNGTEAVQKAFYNYLKDNDLVKNWIGFDAYVGTSSHYSDGSNVLLFDFTYEKTYSTVAEYMTVADRTAKEELYWENFDEMLAAVKDAYGDKYLSIMGDSISTYKGIANNSEYNSTIKDNEIWYGDSAISQAGFTSYLDTYWGNMLDHIEMQLCVDNAWSGASLCSPKSGDYGAAFVRAQNLHNNRGINPDLILVYFGINDTYWPNGQPEGELYTLLQNRGDKTRKQVVEEWIDAVIAKAQSNDFANNNGSYSSWSEAYAIMLYLMTQKYQNADIVLFELVENGAHYGDIYVNSNTFVHKYNEIINALAAYFDLPVVRQSQIIDETNYEFYTHDWYILHPNAAGHEVMFKELIYTLYTDLQKNK